MDKTVELYAIEAREVNSTAEQPIHWRLLTTWPVHKLADALQCLEWYRCRWVIEEFFRILKQEGFDIEASELTQGKAVRNLCLLILEMVIKLFIRQAANDSDENLPASSCFSAQEQACMDLQVSTLAGASEKLKNPYPPSALKRYIWVIARLGGAVGTAINPGESRVLSPSGLVSRGSMQFLLALAYKKMCPDGRMLSGGYFCLRGQTLQIIDDATANDAIL